MQLAPGDALADPQRPTQLAHAQPGERLARATGQADFAEHLRQVGRLAPQPGPLTATVHIPPRETDQWHRRPSPTPRRGLREGFAEHDAAIAEELGGGGVVRGWWVNRRDGWRRLCPSWRLSSARSTRTINRWRRRGPQLKYRDRTDHQDDESCSLRPPTQQPAWFLGWLGWLSRRCWLFLDRRNRTPPEQLQPRHDLPKPPLLLHAAAEDRPQMSRQIEVRLRPPGLQRDQQLLHRDRLPRVGSDPPVAK